MSVKNSVVRNPWRSLRQFTQARIALGRTGVSLPTSAHLAFQLAHAGARDAVYRPLDVAALMPALASFGNICTPLHSACDDRNMYLQRPDLGRKLDTESRQLLQQTATPRCALAWVIADGLSAFAIEENVQPFLAEICQGLAEDGWDPTPIAIVQQGRVAVGDEVGELLGADAVVVLIGERPGLSSPDSMGAYMTWAPRVGLTDANRNCISNIRPGGLDYGTAARRLRYLLSEARRRALSGVALKDETSIVDKISGGEARNFLLE